MQLRNKLSYIALGGLLMLIGMLASSVFMSSLFAQRDKFGEIECTKLTVVDGGQVVVFGKDGKPGALLGVDEYGGGLNVFGKDGKSGAMLNVNEHGGSVSVFGKDVKLRVWLNVKEHGGVVSVYGKGEGKAVMGINEYGNGAVSTWDKNGYRQ